MQFGVTERGDAGLDQRWIPWVTAGKPAILITKNPGLLPPDLPGNVIVHCTITGMGKSKVEPYVPFPEDAIAAYHKLIELIGGERCVLRIDPIVPTHTGQFIAENVAKRARGRVRISFLDMYPHARARFKKANIATPGCYGDNMFHAGLEARRAVMDAVTKTIGFQPEVCGEPGFKCTGCVSERDHKALGLESTALMTGYQRKACKCMSTKTELLTRRGQCKHRCLYCYWKS